MVNMKLQRKDGTIITVEGSESEVKRIIGLLDGERAGDVKRTVARPGGRMSIADMVSELSDEGFFNQARTLGEIRDALAAKGRIYPASTLSGKVLSLIRNRKLGRIREDRIWKYVRR